MVGGGGVATFQFWDADAVNIATALQTKTWDVIINGVAQKILLA
jgi:hypothetical protein